MNDQSKQRDEFDIDAAFEDAFLSDADGSPQSDTKGLDTDFFLDADDSTSYASLAGQEPVAPSFDTDTTPNQEPTGDDLNLTEPTVSPSPVIDPPPTPVIPTGKKSLFNKKPKKTKPAKPTPISKSTKTKVGDPNKLNMMILGAVVALVLLIAAFVLFRGDDVPEPVAPAATPAVTEDTSDTAIQPPIVTDEIPTQPTNDNDAHPVDMIDVGAIVTAEIPDDPALIKEEIDRLSDKEQRLAEQAKLIDEQLSMMSELTAAKEEQIALLEAQIAQLEAQKN